MKTLDNKAVLADHWKLIEKFNNKLDKMERFACDIYNEIRFDIEMMKVNNVNKCKQCQLERKKLEYNFSTKFSKENDIDPDAILFNLSHILIC